MTVKARHGEARAGVTSKTVTGAVPGHGGLLRGARLAAAPDRELGSGRFWHDRRARPEYPLPWTREKDPPPPASSGTTWPL